MREDDVSDWLRNLAASSPKEDAPLVQLITQWALRGRELHAVGGGGAAALGSLRCGVLLSLCAWGFGVGGGRGQGWERWRWEGRV